MKQWIMLQIQFVSLVLKCRLSLARIRTLPGTEDMTDVYHDYGYHIRSSAVGMLIGLPVCLVIGLTVQVLAML